MVLPWQIKLKYYREEVMIKLGNCCQSRTWLVPGCRQRPVCLYLALWAQMIHCALCALLCCFPAC